MTYDPDTWPDDTWEAETRVTPSEQAWEAWAARATAYAAETCQHTLPGLDPLDNGGLGDPDGDGCSLDSARDYWQAGYPPLAAVNAMRDIRHRLDQLSIQVGATLSTLSRPLRYPGRTDPTLFVVWGATGETLAGPFVDPRAWQADLFMYVARAEVFTGATADLAFAGIISPDLGPDSRCDYWVTHDFTPDGTPRNWHFSGSSPKGPRHDFLTSAWRLAGGYPDAFDFGTAVWHRDGAPPSNLPASLTPDLPPNVPDTAWPTPAADTPAFIAAQATIAPTASPAQPPQPAPLAVPAAPAIPARHL